MCELADCVADALLDINFTPGGPSHLFSNVRWNLKPFKPLLSNGIFDGLQMLSDFLLV
jgi:hypothetical protein